MKLQNGQLVAQIGRVRRSNWARVFADTPGFGGYVGYVSMNYLSPADDGDLNHTPDKKGMDEGREEESNRIPIRTEPPQSSTPARSGAWTDGWNPGIPEVRQHETEKCSSRGGARIDQIVIHVTGTTSFEEVRTRFTTQPASAHYLIMTTGELHQFVPEDKRAWHSGIKDFVDRLYARHDGSWRKYKRYFNGRWAEPHYPVGSLFLDADLRQLPWEHRAGASLVAQADGSPWPDYAYFDQRWGAGSGPIGYKGLGYSPNAGSIGIEILSIGGKSPSETYYSSAMYDALAELVDDICSRHNMPKTRRQLCGHEDVNPVERWGWDPGQGFEWGRIL